MTALDGMLGRPGDPVRCRTIGEVSIHWWPSGNPQVDDWCLCGETQKRVDNLHHEALSGERTPTPDKPPAVQARVFLHTAPDMTPEPTVDEIRAWLRGREGLRPGRSAIREVVKAREALMAERCGPLVQQPAVFLPDDGNWHIGQLVEIRLVNPVVCLACQEGRHALCYGGTCDCGCEDQEPGT